MAGVRHNWWSGLAAVYAIVAGSSAVAGVAASEDPTTPAYVVTLLNVALGMLLISGLFVRRVRPVAGSWMIAVGALAGFVSGLVPIGVVLLFSGVWTGALVFRAAHERPVLLKSVEDRQARLANTWWGWLVVAAVCAALGYSMLYIGIWEIWILSWLAAAITGFVGGALGVLYVASRHRARAS